MALLDALLIGTFRTSSDGRRLFYPWGVLRAGYVLTSEAQYLRLRRSALGWMFGAFVLTVVAMHFGGAGLTVIGNMIWAAVYLAGVLPQCRGLPRVNERVSLERIYVEQALAQDPYVLWAFISIAVMMTTGSAFLLLASPIHRLTGAAGLLLFGASTLFFTGQLLIRRRTPRADEKEGSGQR